MAVTLALMRGINVGGKNILPMKELAAMFESAGCAKVRTFIQSGNVIFTAAPKVCEGLSNAIAAQIAKKYGYRTPVILRTVKQMREAIAGNPFPGEEERLHLMFLQDKPAAGLAAKLDANRSTPDRFLVRGAEIYLHLPNGGGRSRLTNAWFESQLSTVSTLRNWRTVTKLLELMGE
jgi:uncharacterized protein (DUF1697 family)